MKYLTIIAILLLAACATVQTIPQCRHNAIRCALSAGEQYGFDNVRIAGGLTEKGYFHAQAFITINGQDHYLDKDCREVKKEVSRERVFTIREFMASQWPRM